MRQKVRVRRTESWSDTESETERARECKTESQCETESQRVRVCVLCETDNKSLRQRIRV